MSDKPAYDRMIVISGNEMFGMAGGQLEYVSQRVEWRRHGGDKDGHYQVMVVRFTDHDVQAVKSFSKNEGLVDNQYYELEFPIFAD